MLDKRVISGSSASNEISTFYRARRNKPRKIGKARNCVVTKKMKSVFRIFVAVTAIQWSSASFINRYPKIMAISPEGANVGKPLYLTPYIEAGRLKEGRQASLVPPLLDNIVSYSGFFTVNKITGSNVFFWFFPCEDDPATAPLAVWLQGGPGASSIFATFEENGPFRLEGDLKIGRKPHYWTQKMSVIYIDQPVGTGFSYTENDAGYPNNEVEVARDLLETLKQFFEIFPGYKKNDFFITGESYAGKYIPALGYAIHQYNTNSENKINLKGLAIGNGWVDPPNMIDYANLLYGFSFIDLKTKNAFQKIENKIKTLIKNKKYMEAFGALDKYIDGDLTPYPTLVTNVTGITWYYNFLHVQKSDSDNKLINYLNQPKVRKSIHVGNLTYNDQNNAVEDHLRVDTLVSIVPKLEVLLDNYRVLLYNGQLDLICAYPLTMNYVRKMKWKADEEYAKAMRKQWLVGEELAGYAKSAGNFSEVLVRNAGHMVPADQPVWALDLITRFTRNQPLITAK